jgi:DNA-binding MarR family transcriptional regulator
MCRRDVADYLGLTLETVSRVLSAYQRKGYVKTTGPMNRHVIVLDPAGLAELDRTNLLLHPRLAQPTRPLDQGLVHCPD